MPRLIASVLKYFMHSLSLDSVLSQLAHASDYQSSLPFLKQARARLELVCACGAMLMLEQAFINHPVVLSVTARTDPEGGYDMEVCAHGAHGAVGDINHILLERAYRGDPRAYGTSFIDTKLALCFADFSTETLETAQAEVSAAMDHFSCRSPTLFADIVGQCVRGGDAVEMARAAGLEQVSTTLEAARLARATRTPLPSPTVGLRI